MEEKGRTRHDYHEALAQVTQEVLAMGVLVQKALRGALEGLVKGDLEAARKVIRGEPEIDRMQTAIEDRAVTLVATEQPVATDLRRLVTGLKIVTQLERMGDHAAHVARAALELAGGSKAALPPQIDQMGRLASDMLRAALKAMVDYDAAETAALMDMDRRMDALYHEAAALLTARMRQAPEQVDASLPLIFVCRHLERLADQATNIGEWTVYGETARHVELNP